MANVQEIKKTFIAHEQSISMANCPRNRQDPKNQNRDFELVTCRASLCVPVCSLGRRINKFKHSDVIKINYLFQALFS